MEAEVLRRREQEAKLITRLGELTTDGKVDLEKKRIRAEMLTILREYIDNRFPVLIVADCVSKVDVEPCLSYIDSYLDILRRQELQPLTGDFIRWIASKSILSAISPQILEHKPVTALKKFMNKVVKENLQPADREPFFITIIMELHRIMCLNAESIFLLPEDTTAIYGKARTIDVADPTGTRRTVVIDCLVNLLLVNNFMPSSMTPYHHSMLWNSTLRIFANAKLPVMTTCMRLWSGLLERNFASWMVCRLAMDKILQIEGFLVTEFLIKKPKQDYLVTQAKFIEVLSTLLPEFDTNCLAGIDMESVIVWGTSALKYWIQNEVARERLEILASSVCDVLCCVQAATHHLSQLTELKELVEKLVTVLLARFEDADILDRLRPFMAFLVTIDVASGSKEPWLKQMFDQQMAKLPFQRKRLASLKLARILLAALVHSGPSDVTKNLLQGLTPTENEMMKAAEEGISTNNSLMMLALLGIVGDLADAEMIQPSTAVAFLSLPFLSSRHDDQLANVAKRHSHSIPLLGKFRNAIKWTAGVSKARIDCFTPLVKVTGFKEWRLSILLASFKDDQDIRKAAHHFMPEMLRSVDYHSIERMVNAVFDAARGEEELDDAMLAAAASICANALKTTGGPCLLCAGDRGAVVDENSQRQIMAAVAPTLLKALSCGLPGIGCASLLTTAAFHLDKEVLSVDMAEKSLIFIHPRAEEGYNRVRDKYMVAFKEVVAAYGETLDEKIRGILDQAKMTTPTGNVDEYFVKFISVCAKTSPGSTLAYWAFKEYFSLILSTATETDISLANSFRSLVKDIASDQQVNPTLIFARNVRAVSSLLCNHLLSIGKAVESPADLTQEVDDTMELIRKLFYFDNVPQMLEVAAHYLVPVLKGQSEGERQLADVITRHVYSRMEGYSQKKEQEFIPNTLARYISFLPLGQAPSIQQMERICGSSLSNVPVVLRAKCNAQLLQTIAYNEEAVFKALYYLNRQGLPPNPNYAQILTEVMTRRCGYVGQLMRFRLAMSLDEHYEVHPQILKSFHSMIGLMDEQFIDQQANRVMSVLRVATVSGDRAVPLWVQFTRRLSAQVLGQLLPRILLDIQPLLKYESSWELFAVIFDEQATRDVDRESFELTADLINGTEEGMARMQPYIRNKNARGEKKIHTGIRLLTDECETVGRVVLEKLYSSLDIALDEEIISKLVPVLLQTLRRCNDKHTRLLVVKCLGRIGAVDPGRLTISTVEDPQRSPEAIVFVDSVDFMPHLIERSWQAYTRETNSMLSEKIEFCIQEMLARAVATQDENRIMERLSEACRRDIAPLRSTQLISFTEPKLTSASPIIDHVMNFETWLQQCFVLGAIKVRQDPLKHVFRALKWMGKTRDTLFTRYILSQLIIRLIIEDEEILEQYQLEMEMVLRRVVEGGPSWMQLAAHIVFSIMDTLEQYARHRKASGKVHDQELKRTEKLLNGLVSSTTTDGQLLIVASAEKCNCFFRALKWCEQYGIKQGGSFDRSAYFHLEKIYMHIQNVDGVVGAYECLSRNVPPSGAERILALEANGDYHEAMALYSLDKENEPQMVNCLLRLNQPQLALSTATTAYERYLQMKSEDSICDILRANQIEAASHLRDWLQVEKLLEDREPLNLGTRAPWGGACAAILCAVKCEQVDVMNRRLNMARETLIDQLTAMTIEHSDTYTQAYNYITQLQILDEIGSAASVNIGNAVRRRGGLVAATSKWKTRSDRAIQCASSLEPVLRVRRELLRMFPDDGSTDHISQLLVQSCRLARQAGHLQIAWTFLVEAQSLDVNHKEVGMEQARFEFQKGDQQQAISLLSKLLHDKFSEMTGMFDQFVPFVESGKTQGSGSILHTTRDARASFAEVQLLRAEYMMKAGAVSSSDLYKIYMALNALEVPSEDLFYRIAVFCDRMYTLDTNQPPINLAATILKVYGNALRYGRNHLFHAMPRMLTLWLDVTQKMTKKMEDLARAPPQQGQPTQAEMIAREKKGIDKLNREMHTQFQALDSYYFYTAFPQLISRIVHPNEEVFQKLKIILADLIFKYPHQCLWLSIAVYRSGQWDKTLRQKRCNMVYQVARSKDRRVQTLIDQYDYVSALIIQLADHNQGITHGLFNDLNTRYPALYNFFKNGTMDQALLMGAKERKLSGPKTVTPTIMVPLTEMMDHAMPRQQQQQLESFSQINIDQFSPEEQAMGALPEVLIHSVDKQFLVLKSMQKPKRLTLRGADGRSFQIMCKPGDELRKDARFMDVNRMMNSLMRQNPESRRRGLHVKTFTVLPLQAAGGILEWVPNLAPYRHVLQPLIDVTAPRVVSDSEWFQNWDKNTTVDDKLKKMRGFFYEHYPLVMAEWFRRHFSDPSTWHSARSNFAKSAAVMSMIGFVLGLGDRHGENILLDLKDGCVVHVDYNLIFNKGETLPVKEVVPFRLTRNMIHGLGPTGVEGAFRKSCEATMKVMRESRETLLTVIQTFVHDPLLEWQDSSRAQQNRRDQRPGQSPIAASAIAADAVALIGKRLEGHIVTPDVYRFKYSCAPMSLEGQVNKLIEIASDEKQLALMYIGWAPFI